MKLPVLLSCLYIYVVWGEEGNIRCSLMAVEQFKDTVLECQFPENLNASKKDFTIYHYTSDKSSESIVDCWWIKGTLDCFIKPGFEYNKAVNTQLAITIRNITATHIGNYACQAAGYGPNFLKFCNLQLSEGMENTCTVFKEESQSNGTLTCYFSENIGKTSWNFTKTSGQNETETAEEESSSTLVIMLISTLTSVAVVAVAAVISFLIYKRRYIPSSKRNAVDNPESEPMLEKAEKDKRSRVTQDFQEYLERRVRDMYPDITETFYFVPPVYFNKIRYTVKNVANEAVHVPDGPTDSDIRYDRAMQHVLHCLHHMAEQEQQHMFVLTHLNYEDYLRTVDQNNQMHLLPKPTTRKVKCTKRFDFLIIHRQHGVLVGVVNAVGESSQQNWDEMIVEKVQESMKQLQEAASMMDHLVSDTQSNLKIHKTLILPNVSYSSLERAVARQPHQKLEKTELFLCADHVSQRSTPWDLSSEQLNKLKQWWSKVMETDHDEIKMTDELYLKLISRLCGPATQFSVQKRDDLQHPVKTLEEAVSLTGELYERFTLYPDMIQLLEQEKVVVVGPPNTGKTRLLALTGKKWIQSGHYVQVFSGNLMPCDTLRHAFGCESKPEPFTTEYDKNSTPRAYFRMCDFKKEKEVDNTVDSLVKTKREASLYVLVDDVEFCGKHFKKFCKSLKDRCSDVHLWATSSTDQDVPDGWETFTRIVNCPPAVVREAARTITTYAIPAAENEQQCTHPTDGPPVKYMYHKMNGYITSHDCKECGKEMGDYVIKHLIIRNDKIVTQGSIASAASPTSLAVEKIPLNEEIVMKESTSLATCLISATVEKNPSNDERTSFLQSKDLLIVFECNINQGEKFVEGLTESGIEVRTLKTEKDKDIDVDRNDFAIAMRVDQVHRFRPRRKIVVYVESNSGSGDQLKKCRAMMCCTSQLVVVRRPQK